ncbi:hypothetical protein O6H91_04G133200 [Diphasiastrum complanatum]|uniref:Uncharacterized protein n=1 Tax=Diphasiastrum complanatum TaxID=34168 RepID=A0ACC2E278_DIPCM|nr:hypothetical protein O6H91_04G133200 [Diphasiastrum complanatum]
MLLVPPLPALIFGNDISTFNSLPSILAGDFNMYLHPYEGPNCITFAERLDWNGLVDDFNFTDAISLYNSPRLHSWDNGRPPPFYTFAELIDFTYPIMVTGLEIYLAITSLLFLSLTIFLLPFILIFSPSSPSRDICIMNNFLL